MKNKKYITPQIEILDFVNESCLLSASDTLNLKFSNTYSTGEQYSQEREQESIWDEMDDE